MFDVKESINRLLEGNKQKSLLKSVEGETTEEKAQNFFRKIYGYTEIKNNLFRALVSEEQINTLLVGSPAGGKSMFMKIIEDSMNDVYYYDASNSTSAGLIESLYQNQDASIILIDEIGMLKRNDIDALRGFLNDGRILKTLKTKRFDFTLKNIKVFATTNDTDLPRPIRSRFVEYHLLPYTNEEFIECVKFCLSDKFNSEISEIIANVLVAHKLKDVRKAISASRYVLKNDTLEQIVNTVDTMIKNKPPDHIDYN